MQPHELDDGTDFEDVVEDSAKKRLYGALYCITDFVFERDKVVGSTPQLPSNSTATEAATARFGGFLVK